ncbi:MAG: hypothetical protein QM736_24960 [Vicinamibacterales bacterium]
MRRVLNVLLVAGFLGIIATPPVANLLGRDGADQDAENRTLAPFPARSLAWADVRGFLPGLDACVRRPLRLPRDTRPLVRHLALLLARRVALISGRVRPARLALLRRRWGVGGFHECGAALGAEIPELAQHDRARTALVSRARHRLRVYHPA